MKKLIGVFLEPFQTPRFTVHPKPERIFLSRSYLTGPKHATSAASVSQKNVGVVVEDAAGDERSEIGKQACRLHAANKSREVESVSAYVSDATAFACASRICSPRRLLLATGLDIRCEPVLWVFDLY
jgi:accessory colonization factor AcfC